MNKYGGDIHNEINRYCPKNSDFNFLFKKQKE